jgi:hypothetical protein
VAQRTLSGAAADPARRRDFWTIIVTLGGPGRRALALELKEMSQFQLAIEIVQLSVASTWDEAKLEWSLLEVYEADDPETCLCGHFPIIELCVLLNKRNNMQATVGNCCVKKFIGLPSDKIFLAVKRVRKDTTKSLNAEAVHHAFDREWINEWEKNFYLNVMRKRRLTANQATKKQQINELVLSRMKRQ